MPKVAERDRVVAWQRRVASSTKNVYEPWANDYSVDMLEEYFYGLKQWQDESTQWDQRKYVINLFYPSVKISMPSMLFQVPKYKIDPKPTRIDDPLSDVQARAKLQEDTLNSFVQDPDLGFELEAYLGMFDAQFRYGIAEVGYTADFIDNPLAGKPILRDDQSEMLDSDGSPVMNPKVVMTSERLFIKWIPAKQFRVSERNVNNLEACDWCGYYEWHYADDLKANPRYKNTANLQATGRMKGAKSQDSKNPDQRAGMVKVWKIWDLRAKQRRVFAEGTEKFFLEEPFKFLPLAGLKFDEILGQFLPLPPTFNWVHPQNELNDTREMQRVHRKRFIRRYLRRAGAFNSEEEFRKLCEGEDGVSAEVTGDPSNAVVPMQDAPLDSQIVRNIPQTEDDFTRISGISGEAQQVAQSETATQANLIALSSRVRESSKRVTVGKWLGKIGRLLLLTLRENMALPFWIKIAVDPASPMAVQEAQEVAHLWKQIQAEDLGNIDLDIAVELSSMSPVAQEQERQDWLTFLQLMVSPQLGAVLSQSPALLRKTAGLFNIHDERDLREVSKAMEAAAMMNAMAMAQQANPKGQGGLAAPGPTPTNGAIGGQLAQQLPVEIAQRQ